MSVVLYVQVINEANVPQVFIIAAKGKVAPLKKSTIPRLELCTVVFLVRLFAHVQTSNRPLTLLDGFHRHPYLDSKPSKWKEHVANYVALIQERRPRFDITFPAVKIPRIAFPVVC